MSDSTEKKVEGRVEGKIEGKIEKQTKEKKKDIKEQEAKPSVKEESKKADTSPTVLVSELDAVIRERMKEQPTSLEDVKVKDPKIGEDEHFLSLPKDLLPYEKDYAFCWIGKDKRKIDRALDVRGWVLCNKTLFPNLPQHLFSISGAIERGDAILCCMSKNKRDSLKDVPKKRANELLKATLGKPDSNPDMYRPKDSGEDTDEGGLVEGKDF